MFLCGRVHLKLEQRAGFFFVIWQKGERVSLLKWEERGGPKGKTTTHPLPPDAEQRRRLRGVGGGRSGRSGPRGRPGPRGKGREGCGGSIPSLTSSWGDAQRRLGGSGRQWAERFAAAALLRLGRRRAAAVMAWGVEERRRGPFIGALGR